MTSLLIDSPSANRILAALSVEEYQRVLPMLEFVHMELGQVLYDFGDRQSYVYFPTSTIISLVFTTENGSSAELAIIGNDGLVGIPIILGGVSTTHHATVQSAGNAYRLRSELVRREFDLGGGLQSLALRYAQAQMAQMAQSVVCNRHHSVDKQLCRWLLMSLDRLPSNQVRMTHDLIANMLGVRREGVTAAAGKLQTDGLIRYSRGLITVIDRPGLEERVCECYSVIKKELDRLFKLPPEAHRPAPPPPQQETLRERAELRLQKSAPSLPPLAQDKAGLLHELQVHQVELEMQLEALNHSFHEADVLRIRYADIYDFAPVGYFTLDADASILDLNLSGAILLGIKRSEKGLHRFNAFVAADDLPEFNRFLAEVMNAQCKKICEIDLSFNTHRSSASVRIEAVPDEEGSECRMVVIDISAEKQAQKLQFERERYLRALLEELPAMIWQPGDEQDELKLSMLNALPSAMVVIDDKGLIVVANENWQRFALENSVDHGIPAANTEAGSDYLAICQAAIDAGSPGALEAQQGILSVLSGQRASFSMEYLCPTGGNVDSCFLMHVSPLGEQAGRGAVITHTDISERKQLEERLRHQALHDEVTHLPNRLLLSDRLSQSIESNKRNGTLGALIYLGLDPCTLPNGNLGNDMNESFMSQIALRLQSCVRAMDTVARIGENEFIVVIDKLVANQAEATFEAGHIAKKICTGFAAPFPLAMAAHSAETIERQCDAGAGVILFSSQNENPDSIISAAGMAMQRARKAGRNLVRFHETDATHIADCDCFQDGKRARSERFLREA